MIPLHLILVIGILAVVSGVVFREVAKPFFDDDSIREHNRQMNTLDKMYKEQQQGK